MRIQLTIWLVLLNLLAASCGGHKSLDTVLSPDSPAVLQAGHQPLELATLSPESAPAFPNDKASVERQVSDDSVTLLGRDWHEKSESAEEVGSTLELNGGESAWGIYALGGFGQVQPGSVYASFFTEDDMPCRIYLGVADFSSGHWRFMDAGKDDASFVFPSDGSYTSPTGNCYIVVLRSFEGRAKLYELNIGRLGNTELESPAGFTATADPGVVHLDWLPSNGAVGYNVYRSYDRKFFNQIKVNDGLVATDQYDDDNVVKGQLYFYRLTAVAAIESEYSNAVSVFVPALDLPAPQNLRATEVGDFDFEIAWDWDGPSIDSWVVYIANAPDFDLNPPTYSKVIFQPGARKYKFGGLDPGRLYFVRMVARLNGAPGRMTDALPCLTGEQWEWYDIEEIGDGKEPIAAVIADDQICASYMLDNEVHVARNSGVGKPWTVEGTDLNHEVGPAGDGFSTYLDIDFRDGIYLICSVTAQTIDLYAAIGSPGVGWDVELIDKGSASGLASPAAGVDCTVAIADNGFSAAGTDVNAKGLFHYSRPFGKNMQWSKQKLRSVPVGYPIAFDMEAKEGRLYGGCFDYLSRQLYLWSEDSGDFLQVSDNPEGWTYGLLFCDMENVGGAWTMSAYDGYERDLIMLTDTGGPVWEQTIVTDSDDYKTGKGARMEPFRDGLVVVYMGGGIRDWYCSVLRGNGEWETQLMKIGEIDAYERADLKILNDRPVFVVADKITQKVYAIRGNIPPD